MKIVEERLIPTPCPSNHASNLLALEGGGLLCTWFGGTMEGTPDISIYLSRFDPARGEWSAAEKMSGDSGRSEQNPALFRHPSGELWLLWTAQIGTDQGTAIVRIRRSADEGASWSPVEVLFDEAGTFIRHAPVVNPAGAILMPIWHSNIRNAFGDDPSLVKVSRDGGGSWDELAVPGSEGCVHMDILEDCNLAFYRRRPADNVFRSTSSDGGLTWSQPEATPLPNNNSSIQARMLEDGRLAIIFNDIAASGGPGESSVPPWVEDREGFLALCNITDSSAVWGVPRNPLVIASSTDQGLTWAREIVLEADASLRSAHDETGAFIGDYSYPSILQTADGKLQVSYSYLRDCIKHVTLSV